jgi:hypothetical protein
MLLTGRAASSSSSRSEAEGWSGQGAGAGECSSPGTLTCQGNRTCGWGRLEQVVVLDEDLLGPTASLIWG